jgi:hypothetical protein
MGFEDPLEIAGDGAACTVATAQAFGFASAVVAVRITDLLLVTRRIRFRRIPHWPAGVQASLVEHWAEAAG